MTGNIRLLSTAQVVLAYIRERANLEARRTRIAKLAVMTDEVNVQGIITVRSNELTKNLVSFFVMGYNEAYTIVASDMTRRHAERPFRYV